MTRAAYLAVLLVMVCARASSAQDLIDLSQATIERSAPDVASWPITTAITRLDLGASDCNVEFSMKAVWPNVLIPGWGGGSIAYTLWMVRVVGGQVYAGGGIEFWTGRVGGCGPAAAYVQNWFYDASWGPLNTAGELTPGESVGFFVTAGDARAKDVRTVTARSAVVAVRWPGGSGGTFTFDGAPPPPPPPAVIQPPPPIFVPPPVPPPAQPPSTAGLDYTEQLRQILAAQQAQLVLEQNTNAQVSQLNKSFGETIGRAMAFVGKYIAPAVAAFIAAKKL